MSNLAQQSFAFEGVSDGPPRHPMPRSMPKPKSVPKSVPKSKSMPASKPASRVAEIRPPAPDERRTIVRPRRGRSVGAIAIVLAVAIALGLTASLFVFREVQLKDEPIDQAAIRALVERIVMAESNGDPNARNKRSSATGAAQFLDDTWLEAVRRHRRDLVQGRSDKEVLELRRDAGLAREITARTIEQNAAMLGKRGLPITPGSLYLVHFAGPAGAVALLTAAENADAAALMAAADVTGRTTRDKLVTANPFLKVLTVGDLKVWADRKMAVGNSPGRS
jgi:hypothetical protein